MLIKIIKERWYYYIVILVFIVVILFSVLQAHSYLIGRAENDLDKEIALFVSEISNEYNRFESEMVYNSSIGSFESILKSDALDNSIKEKIRRVYSMNIDIIDKISVYNDLVRRDFVIEDSNYFKVSPLIENQVIELSKVKSYMNTGDEYKLIIPVYNNDGILESNVLITLNIENYMNIELKRFYLGESSWAWYYDEYSGMKILGNNNYIREFSMEDSSIEYIRTRLEKGYKGKFRGELTLEESNDVISSFYPIKIGSKEMAVGFSVSRELILGRINLVISIIVLSFISMIVLIVLLFLKLIRDEVEIKEELKKSNDTLDKILKEIPTTIVIHNSNLDIVYINDYGKKIFEFEEEISYVNLTLKDNFINYTLENLEDVNYHIKGKHRSIRVLKNTVRIEYYGQEMFLTSVVDISEIEEGRKLAEESNRLKSEFIANISHEIRTPMNGIIASAEILEGMDASVEQKEYIAIIEQSSNHLMVIINDILDLSKIESGKLIIEDIHFNTRDVIESVYDQFIIKANQKKIEIINDININVPNDLIGDPNRLKQVLTNLIGNAVKFTSSGFIYIGIDLEKITDRHAKLLFTIADTGIGISKDALGGIFEPFIQADGSITRNFGGTGLGTTISKKIVNEMGGSISVDSPNTLFKSESSGTVFTFDITFELANASDEYEETRNIFEGISVLVVEDNPINIKIIERMLNVWGINSTLSKNVEEALLLAQNTTHNFDVLITDMILEDIYCNELISKLESNKLLPDYVLIVSSDSDYNRVTTLRNRGFDIILKPIKQSSLYNVFKLYSENLSARKKNIIRQNEGVVNNLPFNRLNISLKDGRSAQMNPSSENDDFEIENQSIKGKILVAEDNAINMKIILKYLSKFDLESTAVVNGQEAVEILKKEEFDLVFMDLQMPIMNGIDATKIIRKRNKKLIIIAMTANAMDVHKEAIYEVGMDDFLSKPLKFNDIKSMLVKHLDI